MSDDLHTPDGEHRRKPYGQNLGDMWLAPGSPVQDRLDAQGEGLVAIWEVMDKDGEVQPCVYVTALPELIEQATAGHEQYVAAIANRN